VRGDVRACRGREGERPLACPPSPDPAPMRVPTAAGSGHRRLSMKRTRHTPEQIITKLREADAMLAAGRSVGQVVQALGVSEQTFHRWRNQYGGMKADEARRLRELKVENARLKKLVAEQAIDISILKEANDEL